MQTFLAREGQYHTIRVGLQEPEGFAEVTMCRPTKRNAMSFTLMAELKDAFTEIGSSSIRGVMLSGEGPVFSAGHDFSDMAGADQKTLFDLFSLCRSLMDTMQSIPQPIVAKVHALATAAGCQLVGTCDLAVASTNAGFALPGGKGGLFCHTPSVAIARNISRKRLMEMALCGDVIPAETALTWGLINALAAPSDLDEVASSLLGRACRGSGHSKGLGKSVLYAQLNLDQDQAYDLATYAMAQAGASFDAQEGMAAFLEKRPANWKQR